MVNARDIAIGIRERLEYAKSGLRDFWTVYKTNNAAVAGLVMLIVIVGIAIFAPLIAPYDPYARVGAPMEPPSLEHWLGTNDLGQDIFSELIYGSRVSLFIGFIAALVATLIGTVIGLVAGYFGGVIDEVLMRVTDIWLSIPTLLFTIFLAATLMRTPLGGRILYSIIIAIAITAWPTVARLVRSMTLSIKERLYVEAARAVGAGDAHIMLKHILPNTAPVILVTVITRIAIAMLTEAGLSFLGLGDPTAKSWGMIIHYAMIRNAIVLGMWWWYIPPGLMISLTVLSILLIGLGVEEYLNPRLRRR